MHQSSEWLLSLKSPPVVEWWEEAQCLPAEARALPAKTLHGLYSPDCRALPMGLRDIQEDKSIRLVEKRGESSADVAL